MKASKVKPETFRFEFLRRVLAANTRLLLMVTACLFLPARASAGQAPTITVNGASQVTAFSATITGTVNPNGLDTIYLLQWGTTTAYEHTGPYVSLETRDTTRAFTNQMIGLSPNTTYHYQVFATNSAGGTFSPDMTVTTLPPSPVVTGNPFNVTMTSAGIYCSVNPNGLTTRAYVQWGTTAAYGITVPLGSNVTGYTPVPVSTSFDGLTPNTTYHYQLFATNAAGSGASGDMTVTTLAAPPTPITGATLSVTTNGASIEGAVTTDFPFSVKTAYYFRWGPSPAYGNTTSLTDLSGLSGGETEFVGATLTGLSPGTTYHYQLVVTNDGAFRAGADMTFTTWDSILIDGQLFTYWKDNGAITIIAYNGPGGAVVVPGTINGLSVTTIGPEAFASSAVTNVTIPNSVTNIGPAAFADSALPAVTIPSSVTTIGPSAFAGSALTNIAIPNSVTSIASGAFHDCYSLASVTIPGSVTDIGGAAFGYCSRLTSVTIPGSVTNIEGGAFSFCGGLTNVSIGNGVRTLGSMAFVGCANLTSVVIPDSVVTIEDGGPLVVSAPGGLFTGCTSLTNVTVGKGLTYLGYAAFYVCPNLVSVFFRGNAPTLGQDAFGHSGPLLTNDPATVYYLPGTTGWGSTFDGRPTKLWNPQVLTTDASFGLRQNRFGFTIAGTADIPLVVEACTNLAAQLWVPLQSCTLTNGSVYFSDSQWANFSGRYYRIRSP